LDMGLQMNEFVLGSSGLIVCSFQAKFRKPDKYCLGVSVMAEHVPGLVEQSLSKPIWTNCMQVMQRLSTGALLGNPLDCFAQRYTKLGSDA
jgi:hypothetical protein